MSKLIVAVAVLMGAATASAYDIRTFKNLWGFDTVAEAQAAAQAEMDFINNSSEYGQCRDTFSKDVEYLEAYRISAPFTNLPQYGIQIKVYYRCKFKRVRCTE